MHRHWRFFSISLQSTSAWSYIQEQERKAETSVWKLQSAPSGGWIFIVHRLICKVVVLCLAVGIASSGRQDLVHKWFVNDLCKLFPIKYIFLGGQHVVHKRPFLFWCQTESMVKVKTFNSVALETTHELNSTQKVEMKQKKPKNLGLVWKTVQCWSTQSQSEEVNTPRRMRYGSISASQEPFSCPHSPHWSLHWCWTKSRTTGNFSGSPRNGFAWKQSRLCTDLCFLAQFKTRTLNFCLNCLKVTKRKWRNV